MMRDRIVIIIITLLFPWLLCDAQVIRGTITDSSGAPMASASIYIAELRQGTTTNSNGYYEISLPSGTYTINYQFLGYLPVTRTFTIGAADIQADITLTEQLFEIPAVRVSATGKDPAWFIMRKAIGMAPFHLNRVRMYRAEVYIRGGGTIDRIPPLIKRRMKVEANAGELEEGRYYFSESLNIITFTAPDKYVHRVISSNTNAEFGQGDASPMDYLEASFYQPVLVDVAISPLASNAFSHYDFTFLGSSSQGEYVIDKIGVTPRRKSQQLFSGVIYIVEDQWAIHSLDLTNDNMAGTVRIRQLYTPVEEGIWMPVSHELNAGISIMGVRARATYTSAVKYLEVEPDRSLKMPTAYYDMPDETVQQEIKTPVQKEIEALLAKDEPTARDMSRLSRLNEKSVRSKEEKPPLEIVDNTTFIIDEDATGKDSSYWNEVRPIPLTKEESASLATVSASGTKLARRDSSTLTVTLGGGSQNKKKSPALTFFKDLAGGKRWQLSKETSLEFDGLVDLESFSFNTVDGFVAGTGLSFSAKTGEQGRFTLAPSVKYAFSRQSLMWNVSANLMYDPYRAGNVYLRAGSRSDEFSPSGVNPLVNTVSTLFFRENWMKLYSSRYLIAGHRSDLANGLNMEISAMYEKRDPLENTSSFSFFRQEHPYSDNVPDNPYLTGEEEGYEPMTILSHTSLSLTARLAWTPRQRYRISGEAKINAGSDYPTFVLTWKHGYNFNDTLSGNIDMLMGEIFRSSRFGPLNEFQWRVLGGGFLNSKNVQVQDMHFFNTQASPVLIDNFGDAFYLKPYYSISSTRLFVEGHISYTSPTLLLKRLPGISRTLIRENIGLSVLWTPELGYYYEAGYALSEIFLLAKLGVYAGFRDTSFEAVSVRLTLRIN